MRRALVPAALVTLLVAAIQLEVFSSLRVSGVVFMLVWLWPLCVGLAGYTSLAVFVALLGGVLFDTHAATPFGLTSLVGVILGYAASRLGREGVGDLDSAAIWVTPVIAAIGGFFAPLMYVAGGYVEFNSGLWRGSLLSSMVINAAAFFLFSRGISRVAKLVGGVGERARR
ncbi:MAG: hypothetical protein ACYC1I_12085 [Acidimicrobiales bacterium]